MWNKWLQTVSNDIEAIRSNVVGIVLRLVDDSSTVCCVGWGRHSILYRQTNAQKSDGDAKCLPAIEQPLNVRAYSNAVHMLHTFRCVFLCQRNVSFVLNLPTFMAFTTFIPFDCYCFFKTCTTEPFDRNSSYWMASNTHTRAREKDLLFKFQFCDFVSVNRPISPHNAFTFRRRRGGGGDQITSRFARKSRIEHLAQLCEWKAETKSRKRRRKEWKEKSEMGRLLSGFIESVSRSSNDWCSAN